MRFLALFLMLLTANFMAAQSGFDFWKTADPAHISFTPAKPRALTPSQFLTYQLDFEAIKSALQTAPMEFSVDAKAHPLLLELPVGDGRVETFKIWESPIMPQELKDRWPGVRTYGGQGLRSTGLTVRLDFTLNGFHAFFMEAGGSDFYVEPFYFGQKEFYMAYDRANFPPRDASLPYPTMIDERPAGLQEITPGPELTDFGTPKNRWFDDTVTLRTYRLAVSATTEYAEAFDGTQATAFSEVVTAVNTLSGAYERDIDIRFVLVAKQDLLTYSTANPDPFGSGATFNDVGYLLSNNGQLSINPKIGLSGYDVGHVFTKYTGGGALGVGSLGVICQNNKANGSSSDGFPAGNNFVCIVGQEIGHQFVGQHTFNFCGGNEAAGTAFEPYCGSTIMSYSTWGPDLYFNQASIEEIGNFSQFQDANSCPVKTINGNHVPIVTLPYTDGFSIPFGTPFDLQASAIDPDGDTDLTYCWEQHDLGPQTPDLSQPQGNCPLFRTFKPVTTTERTFPRMAKILGNNIPPNEGEVLPAAYSRAMTFNCTVRDNRTGGGGVAYATVKFKVDGATGPFRVVSPNTISDKWTVGDFVEVKWDVANSNKLPVNSQVVNIELSTDGGLTWPLLLAANTINDGSHYVQVPNNVTTKARVRIHAADNIFFDVSNQNYKIEAPAAPGWGLAVGPNSGKICLPGTFSTTVETSGWLGFSTPIKMSVISGLPPGAVATFGANDIAPGATAALGIDFNNVTVEGDWQVTLRAVAGPDTLTRSLNFTTVSNDFSALALVSIPDGTLGATILPTLKWAATLDANTYDFQLATSPSFGSGTVISSLSGLTALQTTPTATLDYKTMYFWRVRPQNECGFGPWTEPFVFGTEVLNCQSSAAQDLPKNIAFSGTPSITSTITVPFNATITDINITKIQGFHEFFKDLSFSLTSPSGKKVWLMRQKCGATNGNFNLGLDDEAASPFECPPIDGDDHRPPLSPLSSFDGEQAFGAWTFTIKDTASGSGGVFDNFQLEFCASVALDPPFIVNNVPLTIDGGQNTGIGDALLRTSDNNNTDAQLTFTLVTLPKFGHLEMNLGGPLSVGAKFSQADINNGSLRYFDYNNAAPDKFTFVVSDGEGGFIPKTVFLIQKLNVSASEPIQPATQFVLAPNPTADQTMLGFDRALDSEAQVTVSNMAGQLVYSQKIEQGTVKLPIQTSGLPTGIYLVSVRLAGKTLTKKLLVQR